MSPVRVGWRRVCGGKRKTCRNPSTNCSRSGNVTLRETERDVRMKVGLEMIDTDKDATIRRGAFCQSKVGHALPSPLDKRPTHCLLFLPDDCLYGLLPAPFLLSSSVFVVLSFFFVYVPYTRLNWPIRQLLSARKYIVSYRIVFAPATPRCSCTPDKSPNSGNRIGTRKSSEISVKGCDNTDRFHFTIYYARSIYHP